MGGGGRLSVPTARWCADHEMEAIVKFPVVQEAIYPTEMCHPR